MRNLFFASISLILVSANAYSQSCDCYVTNADSIYVVVPMNQGTDTGSYPTYHCNNCSSGPIALPFNFCFYGKEYDTVYINNKGNLTFVHPEFRFSSDSFPLGNDTLMLAPFYSQVDDTPSINLGLPPPGEIWYNITATHMIVQWSTVGFNVPDDDTYNNFQITITNGADTILPAGNNVSYCYYLMQYATGDSGSTGFNGIPSTVGVNKGDGIHFAQFGKFFFRGFDYYAPFDTNDVYWLDNKSFVFNTCVTGNTIPPVILNPDSCNSFTICATDTVAFGAYFICPQQGQKAIVTETAPGLSGISTDTSSIDYIYSISTRIIAKLKDTGTHIITITATDNSSPPLTNSLTYTVIINACGDTSSGINELSVAGGKWSVYPNPNNGKFTVQSSVVSGQWSVEVYNVLGEKIYSNPFAIHHSPFTIDLSALPSGVYFYRITDNEENSLESGKFVVQKQ